MEPPMDWTLVKTKDITIQACCKKVACFTKVELLTYRSQFYKKHIGIRERRQK